MLHRVIRTEHKLVGHSSWLCKRYDVQNESLVHLLWKCPFAQHICVKLYQK